MSSKKEVGTISVFIGHQQGKMRTHAQTQQLDFLSCNTSMKKNEIETSANYKSSKKNNSCCHQSL